MFDTVDFNSLQENAEFKEDSVRAVIIDPILRELGWTLETIVRSKTLLHPVLKTGTAKRPVTLIPDYVLKVGESYACTLDAKSLAQGVLDADNVEQVYSYAVHREIRSVYFALCNGMEFALFRTSDPDKPILYFSLKEIDGYWETLKKLLSPESFQSGKKVEYEKVVITEARKEFDYLNRPLLEEIPVKKQQAKRHFGCNAYFTRQAWNVVAEYIENYSVKGDIVLDSFGGSGVTAVESLVSGRRAIHIDINPLSVFITSSLLTPVKSEELSDSFLSIKKQYLSHEPKTDAEIEETIKKYGAPKDLPLPKGSDVKTVSELFTPAQTAQLALLKNLIKKQKNKNVRASLNLAFYNTVAMANKTCHEMPSGGWANFVMYYRYRLAPHPANYNVLEVFESKYKRLLAAKKEIEEKRLLNRKTIEDAQIIKGSATDLSFLKKESVDYIYTDPPYGKKIPYLDLSTMWNAWLDLDVSEDDYNLEAIEGGEHNKTKQDYNGLISKSIQEMYRVLKFDRWLSFVFAHKDPEFWHLIIDTCEKCGFEYIGAVPQKNGQSSFKKHQHPFTVLSGQLIINFRKTRNPRAVIMANLGMDIGEIVLQTIEGIIAKNDGATLEQINDELIIRGLEMGFLDLLKKEYSDLRDILKEFDYDEETDLYKIKDNARFKTKIDVNLRIKYYLIAFLRRMERQNKTPSFNETVLHIIPLLKNGVTPEHQTILSVLEDIAERVGGDELSGEGGWRLKPKDKGLF